MALTQVSSNGISKPVDLADDEKVRLGTGDDLEIFHGSNISTIKDSNSDLRIMSDTIRIQRAAGGENFLYMAEGGTVRLHYDGTETFATKSGGNTLTGTDASGNVSLGRFYFKQESGTVKALYDPYNSNFQLYDGVKATFGNGHDLSIFHNGSSSVIRDAGSGALTLQNANSEVNLYNNTDNEYLARFTNGGSSALYHDGTKRFETSDAGIHVFNTVRVLGDTAPQIQFNTDTSLGTSTRAMFGMASAANNFVNGSAANDMVLNLPEDFIISNGTTELMARFIKNGNVELYSDNVKRLNTSSTGIEIVGLVYFGQGSAVNVMNRDNDGTLLEFQTTGTARGSITVSGNTVSYNGGHLSRWSQIKGLSSTDKSARPTIHKGTVMSNLDDLCVWKDKEPEQLNMTKVSDTVGDKDVAGVFLGWDEDNTVEVNDFYISMTGDMVIRVAASTTVARGDLLISAGDGTAKPQADDIVRSSTIAKITSTISTTTYADGSKAYPCVLMAC